MCGMVYISKSEWWERPFNTFLRNEVVKKHGAPRKYYSFTLPYGLRHLAPAVKKNNDLQDRINVLVYSHSQDNILCYLFFVKDFTQQKQLIHRANSIQR